MVLPRFEASLRNILSIIRVRHSNCMYICTGIILQASSNHRLREETVRLSLQPAHLSFVPLPLFPAILEAGTQVK